MWSAYSVKILSISILFIWLGVLGYPTQAQDDDLGLIAYIGSDYNVYTYNPATNDVVQITADATTIQRYQWPTWSTDGRLAYVLLQANGLMRGVYISNDGLVTGDLAYEGRQEIFNYAAWSPSNCQIDQECRDLTLLLSSRERGMFVERIRDGFIEGNATIGLGGPPFYYSWSPDGSRMLWQRGNRTLDIYDTTTDSIIETLEQAPGVIQAPAWSPVDDRLLVGIQGTNATTDLVIIGQGQVRRLVEGIDGLVSFGWSPDGNKVAYRVADQQNYGHLVILDAVTGTELARSPTSSVIAFFWSPDSQRIAFVTFVSPPGALTDAAPAIGGAGASIFQPVTGIAWSVLDITREATRRYGSFIPTPEMIYLLTYFDQFAQSHRVWSPDSRHLIYSEESSEGPVISLLDTTEVDSVPFFMAEGVIGIWSFN